MEIVLSLFKPIFLDKGDFLFTNETICCQIVFVNKGVIRQFYKNNKGLETTTNFSLESEFISTFYCVSIKNVNSHLMQAIVPSQLMVISKYDLEFLYIHIPSFKKIVKDIAEEQTKAVGQRIKSYLRVSSEERYKLLLTNNPAVLKHVPLKFIASYLGITIQHLSRIRK
jgi:CRP-like cAMP-binding protein